MPRRLRAGLLVFAVLVAGALSQERKAPYEPGLNTVELHGLSCTILVPEEFDVTKQHSLMVILHGAGGSGAGIAMAVDHLLEHDFVIVAPRARGRVWSPTDLNSVRAITKELVKTLNIGPGRLHGAGYSNGSFNLARLVFHKDFEFRTACWVGGGLTGGAKPPKKAKKYMGALAMAGADDQNAAMARQTAIQLRDHVRATDFRAQPDLGHQWPDKLMPFYAWWLCAQEGRFKPGANRSFAWLESEQEVREAIAANKTGGFVYWYSDQDIALPHAKAFENEWLQDPAVLFFGNQLTPAMVNRVDAEEEFAAHGLKETPAVVVFDAKARVKKVLSGKRLKPKVLAAALRKVARNKKLPR